MSPLVVRSRRDNTPTSSVSPIPQDSQVATSDPHANTTLSSDPTTIIICLAFLVFVLWVIAICLFAPGIHTKWRERRTKKQQQRDAKLKAQALAEAQKFRGLGFGYEGLSRAELERFRQKEEQDGDRSYVRQSLHPPSLCQIPIIPPITIPDKIQVEQNGEGGQEKNKSDLADDKKLLAPLDQFTEISLDTLPEYERGEYQSNCPADSKEDSASTIGGNCKWRNETGQHGDE